MRTRNTTFAAALALTLASPVLAQQGRGEDSLANPAYTAAPAAAPAMQNFRPLGLPGLNGFEEPKNDVPFGGRKLDWGAAFTQQFQGLDHRNSAAAKPAKDAAGKDYNANQLIEIGSGFNTAVANFYLNAQLADGIRVAVTTYLSSRHHNETWVKDGYLLVDSSPIKWQPLQDAMKYMTIKAGHFEINYGDAHFRRSDNGQTLYNPFVGNLIMDAFTTEIGAEIYARKDGWIAMGGITGGEIKGNLAEPSNRSPALVGKLGYDRRLTPELRLRLTGSAYLNDKSPANTLYAGDRAGSRYYYVLENTVSTTSSQASSGLINPGFRREVQSFMLNPFVRFRGVELFGVAEWARGRGTAEARERTFRQYSGEAVYRFFADQVYVGSRYNTVRGDLTLGAPQVSVDRVQLAGGWFVTPNILLKGEWVTQQYHDFPTTDIRHGGKFDGIMVEGVVAF